MKYVVGLFKFAMTIVITITLAIMYRIKILRYTILYRLNKFDVCTYKWYVCKVTYKYCCTCIRYGLISTDSTADLYNEFLKSINENS